MAEGYAHVTGRPGVAMVTSGPGGHEHRDAAVRRLHGLDPDGGDHRPGADRGDRHRRLPGVRHRRHHPLGHQAQRAGDDGRTTSPRRSARRSTSPPPAGPARCSSTSRRTCSQNRRWSGTGRDARSTCPATSPTTKGHPRMIREAAKLILASRAAGALRRRRHPEGPGRRGAARAGRAHRHPRRHHADGPRRLPRRPPAVPRHAGHARQRTPRSRRCRRPTC